MSPTPVTLRGSCTSTSTSSWRRSNCVATPNWSGCRSSSAAAAIRPSRARSSPARRTRPASSGCTRACHCAPAARRARTPTFLPSDPDCLRRGVRPGDGAAARPRPPARGVGLGRGIRAVPTSDDPVEVAEQIRAVVAAETGLSCSVGISDNKQRAKVATGFGKPAGVFALTDANWMSLMADRPVDALWGVGPKTAKKLAGPGYHHCRRACSTAMPTLLTSTFGPRPDCRSCCWPRVAATPRSAPSRGCRAPAATSSPFPATSPTEPKWTRR